MGLFTNRIINRFGFRDPWTGRPVPQNCQRQTPPASGTNLDLLGNVIAPTYTTFQACLTIQPYKGRDRDWLPAGYRETEIVSIISDVQLNVQDQPSQTLGDIVQWNGRTYLVIHRETADGAQQMNINYWEGYGALIPAPPQAGEP
jgi:hypothetical protein